MLLYKKVGLVNELTWLLIGEYWQVQVWSTCSTIEIWWFFTLPMSQSSLGCRLMEALFLHWGWTWVWFRCNSVECTSHEANTWKAIHMYVCIYKQQHYVLNTYTSILVYFDFTLVSLECLSVFVWLYCISLLLLLSCVFCHNILYVDCIYTEFRHHWGGGAIECPCFCYFWENIWLVNWFDVLFELVSCVI